MNITPEIRDAWLSLGYDAGSLTRRALLVEKTTSFEPESILDVGCGTGSDMALHKILSPSVEMSGIDRDAHELEKAQKTLSQLPQASMKLYQSDYAILKDPWMFPDGSFDVVYSNAALMYAHDPKKVLDQMYRISKKAVVLMELMTNPIQQALEDYQFARQVVPEWDIDIVWRNFGYLIWLEKNQTKSP